MKTIQTLLGSAITLSLCLQGPAAMACTIAIIDEKVEPDYWKKPCEKALKNKKGFLKSIEKLELNRSKVVKYARAFEHGSMGCTQNKNFAFQILDRYVGSPINFNVNPDTLNYLSTLIPDNLDLARKREITGKKWLLNPSFHDLPSESWTEAQAREFLLKSENWDIAVQKFNTVDAAHIGRNKLVFDTVIDPRSSKFSLYNAANFALISKDRIAQIQVASMLIDPQFGKPNYEKAQDLLDWYSPFIHENISGEDEKKAASIWMKIGEHLSKQKSSIARTRGNAILKTGNPKANPSLIDRWSIPQMKNLRIATEWPQSVAKPNYLNRLFSPHDYRIRSMREGEAGAVIPALLFNPTGKFEKLWVLQSSGYERLDNSTLMALSKRYRPKLSSLTIDNNSDDYILVPLPKVEWHIRIHDSQWTSPADKSDDIIHVIGQGIKRDPIFYSSCGHQPSNVKTFNSLR